MTHSQTRMREHADPGLPLFGRHWGGDVHPHQDTDGPERHQQPSYRYFQLQQSLSCKSTAELSLTCLMIKPHKLNFPHHLCYHRMEESSGTGFVGILLNAANSIVKSSSILFFNRVFPIMQANLTISLYPLQLYPKKELSKAEI